MSMLVDMRGILCALSLGLAFSAAAQAPSVAGEPHPVDLSRFPVSVGDTLDVREVGIRHRVKADSVEAPPTSGTFVVKTILSETATSTTDHGATGLSAFAQLDWTPNRRDAQQELPGQRCDCTYVVVLYPDISIDWPPVGTLSLCSDSQAIEAP